PDGSEERTLVFDPGAINSFGDFHPNAQEIVFCSNRRNGIDFDLYRQGLAGGEPSLVAELRGWNGVADVSPDGEQALVAHFESNMEGDAYLVGMENGSVEVLTPHQGQVRHVPAAFRSDGKGIFLVSDRNGEFLEAFFLDLEDQTWRRFGPTGMDVESLAVGDGTGAMIVNQGGHSRLHLFDPSTLELGREVALPMGVGAGLHVAEGGSRLALSFSGPRHTPDVWAVDLAEGAARRLTRSSTAGIAPESFVEPELVRVDSFDGLEIPVWLYRPPGVERPPVLVSVHGGPEAQERPAFNAIYQYFLARGLAVAAPNVRGSSGYGKSYAGLDDRRRRMDSVADLAEVGRWIKGSDDLDGRRVALMGGSYGGFMVLAALVAYPELWAAGVVIVGIANFVTFLENTGAYRRKLREAEYGSLEEDRRFLEEISPIHQVEKIEAPLLVIHGANDPRVPLGEATQIVERLHALGRPVEFLVFDDEGHGIVKLGNRRRAYRAVADFLERYL
ncbi:MAG: S9 family peptidase, partial [Actinomycetota bacterium]|nr:S9 family peptidase [Actinomycetota bacterium]